MATYVILSNDCKIGQYIDWEEVDYDEDGTVFEGDSFTSLHDAVEHCKSDIFCDDGIEWVIAELRPYDLFADDQSDSVEDWLFEMCNVQTPDNGYGDIGTSEHFEPIGNCTDKEVYSDFKEMIRSFLSKNFKMPDRYIARAFDLAGNPVQIASSYDEESTPIKPASQKGTCLNCGKEKSHSNAYCSSKCAQQHVR